MSDLADLIERFDRAVTALERQGRPEPRMLKTREVAHRLGVDPRTVERMIADRIIPTRRVGAGSQRVHSDDLNTYMASLPSWWGEAS